MEGNISKLFEENFLIRLLKNHCGRYVVAITKVTLGIIANKLVDKDECLVSKKNCSKNFQKRILSNFLNVAKVKSFN